MVRRWPTFPNPVYDPKTPYEDEKRVPLHRVHSEMDGFGINGVDVFIAGSGPVGATYAGKLVDAGLGVVMCETGATAPSLSQKDLNKIEYQKDIDRFVNGINGALSPVSVSSNRAFVDTLDPTSRNDDNSFVSNGKNPKQKESFNVSAQAVTPGTGCIAIPWTCAVPHFLKGIEGPVIHPDDISGGGKDDKEWESELVYRSETEFNGLSIRHTLVLNTLKEEPNINSSGGDPKPEDGQGQSSISGGETNLERPPSQKGREYSSLPLAARRLTNSPRYYYDDLIVQQHVFEGKRKTLGIEKAGVETFRKKFRHLTNHQRPRDPGSAGSACYSAPHFRGLAEHELLQAKYFVTAAGAVATPQILYNSGLKSFGGNEINAIQKSPMLPALGKYIIEQPMAFSQVVLKKSLVDRVPNNAWNSPNLFVAGNGVIDTAFAANPTLTSMALAICGAERIAQIERARQVTGFEEYFEDGEIKHRAVPGTVEGLFKRVVKRSYRPAWPPKQTVTI
ncbi:GMC oxidoreductase [Ceratobasidium sp. AG-Ba]|nr:GMC oxidoreductase [Ceratobasidium sp. AG-Ba]QRW02219.1 GMC oxidoreductase [Ceratobasidium sp. AG-Ba]